MKRSFSPLNTWILDTSINLRLYFLLRHLKSTAIDWKTPIHEITGQKPYISKLLLLIFIYISIFAFIGLKPKTQYNS
jgi:hypothetical protein